MIDVYIRIGWSIMIKQTFKVISAIKDMPLQSVEDLVTGTTKEFYEILGVSLEMITSTLSIKLKTYSQAIPSPSPSIWDPYPGSPSYKGVTPALCASEQFAK